MPVSWGGMRGTGSITIRIHIQINPGKEKRRHKSMGNVANLLWVLPQRKCEKQSADVHVRWRERCQVNQHLVDAEDEMPLSPPYTWGCEAVWEMENIVTWVTRISSHPFPAKEEPQALPGVFTCAPGCSCISWGSVGEGMEWHVQWHVAGWMGIFF